MRVERVALYVVSSLLIALSGLVILVAFSKDPIGISIATSLIAGGLASVAFAVIRYLDDRASDTTAKSFEHALVKLRESAEQQHEAVKSLRRVTGSIAGQRMRVYDRHPQEEVREEFDQTADELLVDVMGLTLRPFCVDQLNLLESRGRCRLRLLTLDPRSAMFEQTCQQESRNMAIMREDILWVGHRVLAARSQGSTGLQVELRWFRDFPTVTMTRVNDVLFVRPRFLREATQPRIFHERYAVEEGIPFTAYANHFQTAWDSSVTPTQEDILTLAEGARRGGASPTVN